MGNRAVITTNVDLGKLNKRKKTYIKDGVELENRTDKIGVYLHWNGGYDSVNAFLQYCKRKGFRSPVEDCYGWARLCQVIGNFFGGRLSLGIDILNKLDCDNYDNGVFIIDENWDIVGRAYKRNPEQKEYPLGTCLKEIDNRQPENERIYTDD